MKSRSSTRTLRKQNSGYKFEESADEQSTRTQWATLKDLQPDEKAKVGHLIKSLADLKEEKQQSDNRHQKKVVHYEKTIKYLKEENELLKQHNQTTEYKLKEALELLRNLQEQQTSQQSQRIPMKPQKDSEVQTDDINQPYHEEHIKIEENRRRSNSNQHQRPLLQKRIGESEEKLQSLRVDTDTYLKSFDNSPDKGNEILKLKQEINSLTSELQSLNFKDSVDISFKKITFQDEFNQLDTKISEKAQQKPLPKKKEFMSASSSSDSSESDDVELAKRLLSMKKNKQINILSDRQLLQKVPYLQTTPSENTTEFKKGSSFQKSVIQTPQPQSDIPLQYVPVQDDYIARKLFRPPPEEDEIDLLIDSLNRHNVRENRPLQLLNKVII